jgi:Ca2+-transporting ATPase
MTPDPTTPPVEAWHTLEPAAVLDRLGASADGLSVVEASRRLETHGPNELSAAPRVSPWTTLAAQFKNVLILILLGATALSAVLGHELEAIVIAVIVTLAVLLGFVQEYRAERAIEALREMAAPLGHVVRDGAETSVPAREVVPGDVVVLRAGDRIPADARILEAVNLAVDEAALTGESGAVSKSVESLADGVLPIGDRRNMAYAGTLVARGRGRAVVTATGMSTEFGRISGLVQSVEPGRTPLQENLDRLGKTLGKAAVAVVLAIVAIGLARGQPALDMLMFGIALAVAVVPEALPAVVTISLAIGVRRMVRRRALVRRLPVVETLGSTSVICTDKTGTLTRNEMTVRRMAFSRWTAWGTRRSATSRATARRRPSKAPRSTCFARRSSGRTRTCAARATRGSSREIPPRGRSSSPPPKPASTKPPWSASIRGAPKSRSQPSAGA